MYSFNNEIDVLAAITVKLIIFVFFQRLYENHVEIIFHAFDNSGCIIIALLINRINVKVIL